jgi:hypothetical protein
MDTYECNYNLSPDIKYQLLQHCFDLKFIEYVSLKGNAAGLQRAHCENEKIKTLMRSLINDDLNINLYMFVKFSPDTMIDSHTDDSLIRRSCLTWALAPSLNNFAPVYYGEEKTYYSERPLILNTQSTHKMINNSFERYSFQLCFSEEIEVLADMDRSGILFKA